MELFSMEFFMALLIIILIDLVLAGDNAIVIGMAARNVPVDQQKKVIFWGTTGAIVIRALATLMVVKLLAIPGLHLAGGLLLIWIAYKLLVDDKNHEGIPVQSTVWRSIGTIIVADMAMGVDNVVAVAGASQGSFLLVIIGLLLSVPIMVFGSTLVIKLIDKFPVVIYLGAGVLAFTAAKMIMEEQLIETLTHSLSFGKWIFITLIVAALLAVGKMSNIRRNKFEAKGSLGN